VAEALYRLSLAPALEPFRPEIEHASDFLDAAHHVWRVSDAPRVLHYGPDAPPGAVAVPAVVFPGGVRTDGEGIHPVPPALAAAMAAGDGGTG